MSVNAPGASQLRELYQVPLPFEKQSLPSSSPTMPLQAQTERLSVNGYVEKLPLQQRRQKVDQPDQM